MHGEPTFDDHDQTPGAPRLPVPPPPPREPARSGPRRRSIGAGIAVVAFLLVTGLIVAAPFGGTGYLVTGPSSPASATNATVAAAADRLWLVPGSRFHGSFVESSGHRITVDARATNEGSAEGTLTSPTGAAQLLVVDGQVFLKADLPFWRAHNQPFEDVDNISKHWVRIGPETLGIDLAPFLSPQLLAEDLAPGEFFEDGDVALPAPGVTPAGEASVNGAPTQVFDTTVGLRAYITSGSPHRIVRIAAHPPTGPPVNPSASVRTAAMVFADRSWVRDRPRAQPARQRLDDSGLEVDLSTLSADEVGQFEAELERRVTELRSSVDSEVDVALDGDIVLGPCSQYGCLATAHISNKVTSHSPYLSVQEPVSVAVTITIKLDGELVRECDETIAIPPNGEGEATCFTTFTFPPTQTPSRHHVDGDVVAYGQAVVDEDLTQLRKDLADEFKRNRERNPAEPTPKPTAGPTGEPTPGQTPTKYPWRQPALGDTMGGPGEWAVVNRSAGPKWRAYQEQVTGVKMGREYRVKLPGESDVEFEGVDNVSGKLVFIEAKANGQAGLLESIRLDSDGKVIAGTDFGRAVLRDRMNQLRRQALVVSSVPGARLHYVAGEQEAIDKIRRAAENQLGPALFSVVDWIQVDQDYGFKGCP
jgi:hypothetical protein